MWLVQSINLKGGLNIFSICCDVVGSENPVEAGGGAALSAQLMQNPQLLAALQGKMDSMVGLPSGYIQK